MGRQAKEDGRSSENIASSHADSLSVHPVRSNCLTFLSLSYASPLTPHHPDAGPRSARAAGHSLGPGSPQKTTRYE